MSQQSEVLSSTSPLQGSVAVADRHKCKHCWGARWNTVGASAVRSARTSTKSGMLQFTAANVYRQMANYIVDACRRPCRTNAPITESTHEHVGAGDDVKLARKSGVVLIVVVVV